MSAPLDNIENYSVFVYALAERHKTVELSRLAAVLDSIVID